MIDVSPDAPAFVALRYPEDHTPGGRSRVFIDRYRGTILRATNTRTAEAGTRLMNLQRPLHTGDIFGGASRIVWFLAALILVSQAVTGIMMWWNGRAARAALGRQKRYSTVRNPCIPSISCGSHTISYFPLVNRESITNVTD